MRSPTPVPLPAVAVDGMAVAMAALAMVPVWTVASVVPPSPLASWSRQQPERPLPLLRLLPQLSPRQ